MKAWLSVKRRNADGRDATSFVRFVVIAIVVGLLIIAIGEASRMDTTSRTAVPAPTVHDPLAADLARCRGVTAEQLANDDTCRRVWAENRKRFFAPSAPGAPTANTPPKAQDRVPTSVTPAPLPNEVR